MTEIFEPKTHMFHSHRRPGMIIVHGIACELEESEKILTGKTEFEASVQYLITCDGEIRQYLDETARAWHAGVSYWAGFTDINSMSVGIELEGEQVISDEKQFYQVTYTDLQMQTLANLIKQISQRWNIQPYHILGHQDISPFRKKDPGPNFDWGYLAKQGVGVWHGLEKPAQDVVLEDPRMIEAFAQMLALYGYDTRLTEGRDLKDVITAFQIHFLPWNICGLVTQQSVQALDILLEKKFS